MKFMLLVKASTKSEEGHFPPQGLQDAMGRFNGELREAGVRIMAHGLYPSSRGLRIFFPGEGLPPRMEEGPFIPAREVVAGFILFEADNWEEAVAWAKRMPDPQGYGEGEIELRQLHE